MWGLSPSRSASSCPTCLIKLFLKEVWWGSSFLYRFRNATGNLPESVCVCARARICVCAYVCVCECVCRTFRRVFLTVYKQRSGLRDFKIIPLTRFEIFTNSSLEEFEGNFFALSRQPCCSEHLSSDLSVHLSRVGNVSSPQTARFRTFKWAITSQHQHKSCIQFGRLKITYRKDLKFLAKTNRWARTLLGKSQWISSLCKAFWKSIEMNDLMLRILTVFTVFPSALISGVFKRSLWPEQHLELACYVHVDGGGLWLVLNLIPKVRTAMGSSKNP